MGYTTTLDSSPLSLKGDDVIGHSCTLCVCVGICRESQPIGHTWTLQSDGWDRRCDFPWQENVNDKWGGGGGGWRVGGKGRGRGWRDERMMVGKVRGARERGEGW